MIPHLIAQYSLAITLGAIAAITLNIALVMWDNPPRIRHGRIPLQPLPPVGDDLPDLGQQAPEPGSWRDQAITEELARMLTEGNEHP